MKIEELKKMGYSQTGLVDGLEIWDNFNSPNNKSAEMGFIFQFNLHLQEDHIGGLLVTKDILRKIIGNKNLT